MAGKIVASTLNNDTGVLATQNGMTGIAKAWVNYDAVAQSILASFNVSSVTYTGTGTFTINFTVAFPSTNSYAVSATCKGQAATFSGTISENHDASRSASALPIICNRNDTSASFNSTFAGVSVFSS
jgi:hypothetical protein